jgi:hypothetical protein
MPFKVGQTVSYETEVGGFASRTVATVASVAKGKVTLRAATQEPLPGVFRADGGQRADASPRTANERILEVPPPPGDLWGPRSGWLPAGSPPEREGWYEFRRAIDGAVDLCYFVSGTWLTADELAPLLLTGGESWQGLAADPVELYLDEEPAATEAPIQVAQPERPGSAGVSPRR